MSKYSVLIKIDRNDGYGSAYEVMIVEADSIDGAQEAAIVEAEAEGWIHGDILSIKCISGWAE